MKLRLKSTGMTPLGAEEGAGRGRGAARPSQTPPKAVQRSPESQPAEPKRDATPNPLDAVKTLNGLFGM